MRARARAISILAAAFAILGCAASAQATSFLVLPFPETVGKSPIIVRGTIGASYPRWDEVTGERRIYTYTELEIVEVLKGHVPEARTMMVRELGGEKDGIVMEVPGTAKFKRGEDVVVLLKPANSDGSYDIRSLMMGKLSIHKDDSGEEVLKGPALSQPGVQMDVQPGHNDTGSGQSSDTPWTVDRLRQLIKTQEGGADTGQTDGKKDETPNKQALPVQARTQAPALQPKAGGGIEEPENAPEKTPGQPSRISLKTLGFALAALLALGVILVSILKGKSG